MQCVGGIAFGLMFRTIALQRDDQTFRQGARIRRRRNLGAIAVYALSAIVALYSPIVAILLLAAVALAYVAPRFLDGT